VILARPTTSPDDISGIIAARGVVTERGGSTSHAASSRARSVVQASSASAKAYGGVEGAESRSTEAQESSTQVACTRQMFATTTCPD